MKTLALYNIKGGVGKTVAAVNLAYLSAREGIPTALWDLDPQGAATYYFRIKPKVKGGVDGLLRHRLTRAIKASDYEHLDLVPADFSYRHLDLTLNDRRKPIKGLLKLTQSLAPDYERLFLDCPPGISLLSENVFRAADGLLVPMIPTTLSVRSFEQLADHLRREWKNPVKLLSFFALVDRRKRIHREVIERLGTEDGAVLRTQIPYASEVERMGIRREPVCAFAPLSPASVAYAALWEEVKARIE